jgi:hypothetical protein
MPNESRHDAQTIDLPVVKLLLLLACLAAVAAVLALLFPSQAVPILSITGLLWFESLIFSMFYTAGRHWTSPRLSQNLRGSVRGGAIGVSIATVFFGVIKDLWEKGWELTRLFIAVPAACLTVMLLLGVPFLLGRAISRRSHRAVESGD